MENKLEVIETTMAPVWLQSPEEPDDWYSKFQIYLALGASRTLTRAFAEWAMNVSGRVDVKNAPASWSEKAREWHWRDRAIQYDVIIAQETAATVARARAKIQQLAYKAVEALEEGLENPRTRVAAAEKILDRAGLPAKTVHIHEITPYRSDDFNEATKELDEWKKTITDESG